MRILPAFLFAAWTAFAGSALAETVGNVGAVNQSAEASGRKLSIGAGVAGESASARTRMVRRRSFFSTNRR